MKLQKKFPKPILELRIKFYTSFLFGFEIYYKQMSWNEPNLNPNQK